MSRKRPSVRCGKPEARARVDQAREFLDAAELLLRDSADVATSNAVLAGIAGVDALCCYRLGEKAREHRAAVALVESVQPGGGEAARALERLLRLKNKAQYDARSISPPDAAAAVEQARRVVELAEEAVPS